MVHVHPYGVILETIQWFRTTPCACGVSQDGAIDIVDGEGDKGPRLKKGTQSGRVLVENPIRGAGDDDDDDDAPDRTDVQKMCQSCGKKPQRSNEEPYCQECWEDD